MVMVCCYWYITFYVYHILGACNDVVSIMNKYAYEEAVCQRGCHALGTLSVGIDNLGRLKSANACEAIVLVMNRHEIHKDVIQQSCQTIIDFCNHKKLRDHLREVGAIKMLINVMRNQKENISLLLICCQAIRSLCHMNSLNIEAFSLEKTCELLSLWLKIHYKSEQVCEQIIPTIHILVSNNEINKNELGECGGGENLIFVLQEHYRNANLSKWVCNCIYYLCLDSDIHVSKLITSGIHDILSMTLSKHYEIDYVVEPILKAIPHLVKSDAARELFGAAGITKGIVKSVIQHEKNELLSWYGCQSIITLTESNSTSNNNHNNQNRFGMYGAIRAIILIMQRYPNNYNIQKDGCIALYNLCLRHDNNKLKMISSGGLDLLNNIVMKQSTSNNNNNNVVTSIYNNINNINTNNNNNNNVVIEGENPPISEAALLLDMLRAIAP